MPALLCYNVRMKIITMLAVLAAAFALRAEWERVESFDPVEERMTFIFATTGTVSGVGSRTLAYEPRLVFTMSGPLAAKSLKEYDFSSGICIAFAAFTRRSPTLTFRFGTNAAYTAKCASAWENRAAIFGSRETFAMLTNATLTVRYVCMSDLVNDVQFSLRGLRALVADVKERVVTGGAKLPTTPEGPPRDPFRWPPRNLPRYAAPARNPSD